MFVDVCLWYGVVCVCVVDVMLLCVCCIMCLLLFVMCCVVWLLRMCVCLIWCVLIWADIGSSCVDVCVLLFGCC